MKNYKLYLILISFFFYENLKSSELNLNSNYLKYYDYLYGITETNEQENFEINLLQKNDIGWKIIFTNNNEFNFYSFFSNFFKIKNQKNKSCIFLDSKINIECTKHLNTEFNQWKIYNLDNNINNSYHIFIVFLPQYFFFLFLYISYFFVFLILLNLIRIAIFAKN